ncbi:MAG: serine/threonine protein kinase [Blastocatellia bacterium]
MLGKIIGNYKITGELAQGGMGAVYRGRHQSLPRDVVVKSILLSSFPPQAQDQLKARFVREAYIQAQLDHQNIVRVYEFFTTVENYYLVMEFIDGMSLRDLIKRQGALAPAHAIPLFKQALSALGYAHNFNYVDESGNRHTGVIHRDIKPANMLLDGSARLKITDFGIVKLAGESSLTRTGFNPGTVEFMSPEQIRGLEVDARSDLYSLGVTFYEALTGRLPFPPSDTGSEYEVLRGHIELAPPPIATVKPDVPEAIAALVMRSLQKDPGARFQSAAEFLDALLDCEQSSAAIIARSASKPPQVTHSMTEFISYDTRLAPNAQPTTPQQSVATQVIEAAQTNHHASPPGQQPRRYGLLVAVVFVALLAVAGIAFVFLKSSDASPSAATNVSTTTPSATPTPDATPIPAATPTPAATQEDARLIKARKAEANERYYDAIILYGEYLVEHALDTAQGVKDIQNHKTELEKFFGLINGGKFEMNSMRDYAAAERSYTEALKLRPDSKLAQEGLKKAKSRQGRTY